MNDLNPAETQKISLDALMGIKENYHQDADEFMRQLQLLRNVSLEKDCVKVMEDYDGLKILCQAWQQILFNTNWKGNILDVNVIISRIMRNLLARSHKLKSLLGKIDEKVSVLLYTLRQTGIERNSFISFHLTAATIKVGFFMLVINCKTN